MLKNLLITAMKGYCLVVIVFTGALVGLRLVRALLCGEHFYLVTSDIVRVLGNTAAIWLLGITLAWIALRQL